MTMDVVILLFSLFYAKDWASFTLTDMYELIWL